MGRVGGAAVGERFVRCALYQWHTNCTACGSSHGQRTASEGPPTSMPLASQLFSKKGAEAAPDVLPDPSTTRSEQQCGRDTRGVALDRWLLCEMQIDVHWAVQRGQRGTHAYTIFCHLCNVLLRVVSGLVL